MAVMERNLERDANPEAFAAKWAAKEKELSDEIVAARELVERVQYTRQDLFTIASLTASMHVDGHRADLVILKAARAHAAFQHRTRITEVDIAVAAELALPHRVKKGPFHQTEVNLTNLQDRIEQLSGEFEGEGEAQPRQAEEETVGKKNRR
jgi:Mg-chelatase subunit ChlI